MSRRLTHDKVFKALADRTRRRILDLLKDRPLTTGDICSHFKRLDRCTVMMHIGVLEKAGLLISERRGRFRWNYLDVVPIRDIYDRWIHQYATPSVQLLSKLKHDLESAE